MISIVDYYQPNPPYSAHPAGGGLVPRPVSSFHPTQQTSHPPTNRLWARWTCSRMFHSQFINDLTNSIFTHRQIVDTVDLFHAKRSRKLSLRFLASYLLRSSIQVGWRAGRRGGAALGVSGRWRWDGALWSDAWVAAAAADATGPVPCVPLTCHPCCRSH